jgi:hypothetical protein
VLHAYAYAICNRIPTFHAAAAAGGVVANVRGMPAEYSYLIATTAEWSDAGMIRILCGQIIPQPYTVRQIYQFVGNAS